MFVSFVVFCVCLSVGLRFRRFVRLFAFARLFVWLFDGVRFSVHRFGCLFVGLSVCLFVCVSLLVCSLFCPALSIPACLFAWLSPLRALLGCLFCPFGWLVVCLLVCRVVWFLGCLYLLRFARLSVSCFIGLRYCPFLPPVSCPCASVSCLLVCWFACLIGWLVVCLSVRPSLCRAMLVCLRVGWLDYFIVFA